MSREARVGIFVLLGLIVLTFFTFRVSKWGLIAEKGYRLTVDFDTAAGLEPKSDVKMAGVPIGKVEEIQLVGNRARLVLRIHEGSGSRSTRWVPSRRRASLARNTSRSSRARTRSATCRRGQVANTLSPTNLDEMVRKLSAIGDDVKKFTESLLRHLRDGGGEEGARGHPSRCPGHHRVPADRRRGTNSASSDPGERRPALRGPLRHLRDQQAGRPRDDRQPPGYFRHAEERDAGLVRKAEEMSERVSGIAGTTART